MNNDSYKFAFNKNIFSHSSVDDFNFTRDEILEFFYNHKDIFQGDVPVFQKDAIINKISKLIKQRQRDIYVWDEMTKLSEVFFLSTQYPFKRPSMDLCCGYGYWISKMLKCIDVGVDLFPSEGCYARSIEDFITKNLINGCYLTALQADVTQPLPLPKEYFNTIISLSAFEHMEPKKIELVLCQVKRLLSLRGRFLFSVQTRLLTDIFTYILPSKYVMNFKEKYQLNKLMTVSEWQQKLDDFGFQINTIQGTTDIVRTVLYALSFYFGTDGYYHSWLYRSLGELFRMSTAWRKVWNERIIPWLVQPVSIDKAALLLFDCSHK